MGDLVLPVRVATGPWSSDHADRAAGVSGVDVLSSPVIDPTSSNGYSPRFCKNGRICGYPDYLTRVDHSGQISGQDSITAQVVEPDGHSRRRKGLISVHMRCKQLLRRRTIFESLHCLDSEMKRSRGRKVPICRKHLVLELSWFRAVECTRRVCIGGALVVFLLRSSSKAGTCAVLAISPALRHYVAS
jgi:hypothetical protein